MMKWPAQSSEVQASILLGWPVRAVGPAPTKETETALLISRTLVSAGCIALGLGLVTSCDAITVTITAPANGASLRQSYELGSATISFLATGNASGSALSFSCSLDGGDARPCSALAMGTSAYQLSVAPLREGPHVFKLTATDNAGRKGSASVSFLIDTPLSLNIWPNVAAQNLIVPPTIAFSYTGATGLVTRTCKLDSEAAKACTSPLTFQNIADGPHRMTITLADSHETVTKDVLFAMNRGLGAVPVAVTNVSAASEHTCALLAGGRVRCWGNAYRGQLGYANLNTIGNDEFPSSAGDVQVGGIVTQIAAGYGHTCALLSTGGVRCWGAGGSGATGYGRWDDLGDDETPASVGDALIGGSVVQLSAGNYHTCGVLTGGAVRCWGSGFGGQLGYGNDNTIGDDEPPSSAGDVNVGDKVTQVAAGNVYTCALLASRRVRCWGLGEVGALGYGNLDTIGDNELPASAGDVDVGGDVVQVAVSHGERQPRTSHTCALLATGEVRCWGAAGHGQLGYGNTNTIGDNEHPAAAGSVNVGGSVVQVSLGAEHTCVLLVGGKVRCWGEGDQGALGYGNQNDIGDDETPASAGDVNVGGKVVQISAGDRHTCAVLESGGVRCWGGPMGRAALGYPDAILENQALSSAGDVVVGY